METSLTSQRGQPPKLARKQWVPNMSASQIERDKNLRQARNSPKNDNRPLRVKSCYNVQLNAFKYSKSMDTHHLSHTAH